MATKVPQSLVKQPLTEVDKAFDMWYYAVKHSGRFTREDAWNNLQSAMRDYHQGDQRKSRNINEYVEAKRLKAFSV